MYYQHIVVPVDGSPFAEFALPWALAIAERGEGRVELVMVREDSAKDLVAVGAGAEPDRGDEDERAYLDALVARIGGTDRPNVSVTLLRGRAAVEIERYARESRAGLVVMATHGHGPLSRAWLGSVADQLVRAGPAPILLVRPAEEERPDVAARPGLRRILVPLDGSDAAEEVLDLAVPLGALWGAAFTLVRVVPLYVQVGSPYMAHALHLDQALMEAARAEAESYLNEVTARLAKRDLNVAAHLADGAPAQVILALADAEHADLIAMRARGRGGIERMVLGSVADKVIRGSHRPILVQTIRE